MSHFSLSLLLPFIVKEKKHISYNTNIFVQKNVFLENFFTIYNNNININQINSETLNILNNSETEIVSTPENFNLQDLNSSFGLYNFSNNEHFSLHENSLNNLEFSMYQYINVKGDLVLNPFANYLKIGNLIRLRDQYDHIYDFIITNIDYSFSTANIEKKYSCQNIFSFQNTKKNNGFYIDNNTNSINFIGAKSINYWGEKICKDCQMMYSYIPTTQPVLKHHLLTTWNYMGVDESTQLKKWNSDFVTIKPDHNLIILFENDDININLFDTDKFKLFYTFDTETSIMQEIILNHDDIVYTHKRHGSYISINTNQLIKNDIEIIPSNLYNTFRLYLYTNAIENCDISQYPINEKIVVLRHSLPYEYNPKISFSIDNSNSYNALVSLVEKADLLIEANDEERIFYFIPKKSEEFNGLYYSPLTNIKSFSFNQGGDSLITMLNVKNHTIGDTDISLLNRPPQFFLDYFSSNYWQQEAFEYNTNFFKQLIYEKYLNYNYDSVYDSNNNKNLYDIKTIKYNEQEYPAIEIKLDNTTIPNQYTYFNLLDTCKIDYKFTNETEVLKRTLSSKDIFGYHISLTPLDDSQNIPILFPGKDIIYDKDETVTDFKHLTEQYIYLILSQNLIGVFKDKTFDDIILNLYVQFKISRTPTSQEEEYAEIADKLPWLENKIINIDYFYNNNLINKSHYNNFNQILKHNLRLENGQLIYWSFLKDQNLKEKVNLLFSLSSSIEHYLGSFIDCHIDPLTVGYDEATNTFNDNKDCDDFDYLFKKESQKSEPNYIADYSVDVTDIGNDLFESTQLVLEGLYNFVDFWNSNNVYDIRNLVVDPDKILTNGEIYCLYNNTTNHIEENDEILKKQSEVGIITQTLTGYWQQAYDNSLFSPFFVPENWMKTTSAKKNNNFSILETESTGKLTGKLFIGEVEEEEGKIAQYKIPVIKEYRDKKQNNSFNSYKFHFYKDIDNIHYNGIPVQDLVFDSLNTTQNIPIQLQQLFDMFIIYRKPGYVWYAEQKMFQKQRYYYIQYNKDNDTFFNWDKTYTWDRLPKLWHINPTLSTNQNVYRLDKRQENLSLSNDEIQKGCYYTLDKDGQYHRATSYTSGEKYYYNWKTVGGFNNIYLIKLIRDFDEMLTVDYNIHLENHNNIWKQIYSIYGDFLLEGSYSSQNALSSRELYQEASNYFKDLSKTEKNYNLSLVNLSNLKNYTGNEIHISDQIKIASDEFYQEFDELKFMLQEPLFISDIDYNLRSEDDIQLTVNIIKYQDKVMKRLVSLLK